MRLGLRGLRGRRVASTLVLVSVLVVGADGPPVPASGSIWSIVHSPNPSTMPLSNDALYAVSALTDNDVWAVGRYSNTSGNNINRTVIEHWDGTTWSIVPSPNVGAKGSELFGVAALSDNDVWAVGDYVAGSTAINDHTLIEHWNGTAWSVVPSPNPNTQGDNLTSVAAISASDVWAVGYLYSIQPLVLHWNGTAWSVVTAGLGSAGGIVLEGISALTADDIWAVGETGGGGTNAELHWNGTRWSVMSANFRSHGQESLGGVAAISSNDVWAVGSYAPTSANTVQTLALHWDGTRWSKVSTPNVNPNMALNPNLFYDVAALRGTDVWAVGYYYLPNTSGFFSALMEHWDGTQWTVMASPGVFGSELRGVVVSGPTDLWAAGSYVNEKNHNPGARTLIEHTTQG